MLAQHDEIDTMIFDEIDVGISGRTAQMVAEKMSWIGKKHQVICISHLAQIAAMADTQFLIEKENDALHTASTIRQLGRIRTGTCPDSRRCTDYGCCFGECEGNEKVSD